MLRVHGDSETVHCEPNNGDSYPCMRERLAPVAIGTIILCDHVLEGWSRECHNYRLLSLDGWTRMLHTLYACWMLEKKITLD